MLCNEPWCWTPREVSQLTDYQAWELVIRPAVKKSREMRRERGGRGPQVGHGWEKSPRKLPNREQYVLVGERLGVPREVSEAEYDRWAATQMNGTNGTG